MSIILHITRPMSPISDTRTLQMYDARPARVEEPDSRSHALQIGRTYQNLQVLGTGCSS